MAFQSTDQTISTGGTLTLAHGLGAVPTYVGYALVCQTADSGYSAGDVVHIEQIQDAANCGVSIVADATNLKVKFGSNTSGAFELNNKSTGNNVQVANATNWKIRFFADTGGFTSTDQTITTGGTLTIAHGRGAVPKRVGYALVCQTADNGYSVGDVVFVGQIQVAANSGCSIKADATNLNVKFGSNVSGAYEVNNNSTGNNVLLANATNWKVRFFASTGPGFTSTDQTISTGGTLTLAHSLGAAPKYVGYALVCTTADSGYSVGDVVFVNQIQVAANSGCSIAADATNLNVKFGSNVSGAFELNNASTGNNVLLANSTNWKVRFFAGTTG